MANDFTDLDDVVETIFSRAAAHLGVDQPELEVAVLEVFVLDDEFFRLAVECLCQRLKYHALETKRRKASYQEGQVGEEEAPVV